MLLGSCENETTAAQQLALSFGRKERGDVYVSVNMTRFEEERKEEEYKITRRIFNHKTTRAALPSFDTYAIRRRRRLRRNFSELIAASERKL